MSHFYKGHLIILLLLIFYGCENDLKKIQAITEDAEYPTLSGKNVEIEYTDSAKLKSRVIASVLNKYTFIEEPYYEFPEGITVYIFKEDTVIESRIVANYAKYWELNKLWFASGDVTITDYIDGDQINSEEIYWDMEKEILYSEKFTRVETKDGVFYGKNGFESNQDFSKWRLKGTTGTVNIEDEF